MSLTHDVIVIGGGAIGAACARELALSGRRVLVLEPDSTPGQAWRAAAGMLAPQIEADGDDPLLPLGLAARDHYSALASALLETTGVDVGLWQEGIARVAADDGEAGILQAKVGSQVERGYECEWLDRAEVHRRWPWLGPVAGALWAPQDGALDPSELVRGLLADAHSHGASVLPERVTRIEHDGSRVSGVSTEQGQHRAPEVVLAAGAWSGLIEGLPRPLPIQPVRGQMAAVPWPPGVGRAIVYHKDCYLLARGDEAILGSTMEYVGFRPEVTPEGVRRIFAATLALGPGLARGKVRRTWAGLRPITADGLPVLGSDPALEGMWYATGHGRNGILLAGLTGVLIRTLMDGQRPSLDLTPFYPDRFAPIP